MSADHACAPAVVQLPTESLAGGQRDRQIIVAYGEAPGGFQSELPQAAAGIDLERPEDAAIIEHVADPQLGHGIELLFDFERDWI